jgi:Kef-type K+ transport system membrane component KefB
MSITAFPVLARILEERNLTHTPLGTTAITCAAVDDVTAWSILAFVVAITTAGGALETLLAIVALSLTFVLLMLFVGRPLLQRVLNPDRMGDSLSKEHIASFCWCCCRRRSSPKSSASMHSSVLSSLE